MKKILAMLMSVSMMASLFVSTAVTTHAADEITATVKATSITKAGKVKFSVNLTTPVELNFSTRTELEDEDDPDTEYTLFSGTGISSATLKFAFNSEYFDVDSLTFGGQKDYPSVATNKNESGFAGLTFADDGEKLVVNKELYSMTIAPTFDITGKTVDDINNLKCITDVFPGSEIQLASWPAEGTDKSVVTFKTYTLKGENKLNLVYPDKDAAPADVKVTGITATPAELKALTVGDKGTIAVAVAPADATEKGVTFVSDAEDVISVDADGNYEAKSAGTAKITITAKDGSGVTATVEVSVSAPVIPEPDKVEFVKAVKSDKAATGYWVFKVNKGITETLKVTYANADEKLELDAPAAIGGESDVTFALYLTVTGDRIGKAYTAAVAHGADSATGTAITLD